MCHSGPTVIVITSLVVVVVVMTAATASPSTCEDLQCLHGNPCQWRMTSANVSEARCACGGQWAGRRCQHQIRLHPHSVTASHVTLRLELLTSRDHVTAPLSLASADGGGEKEEGEEGGVELDYTLVFWRRNDTLRLLAWDRSFTRAGHVSCVLLHHRRSRRPELGGLAPSTRYTICVETGVLDSCLLASFSDTAPPSPQGGRHSAHDDRDTASFSDTTPPSPSSPQGGRHSALGAADENSSSSSSSSDTASFTDRASSSSSSSSSSSNDHAAWPSNCVTVFTRSAAEPPPRLTEGWAVRTVAGVSVAVLAVLAVVLVVFMVRRQSVAARLCMDRLACRRPGGGGCCCCAGGVDGGVEGGDTTCLSPSSERSARPSDDPTPSTSTSTAGRRRWWRRLGVGKAGNPQHTSSTYTSARLLLHPHHHLSLTRSSQSSATGGDDDNEDDDDDSVFDNSSSSEDCGASLAVLHAGRSNPRHRLSGARRGYVAYSTRRHNNLRLTTVLESPLDDDGDLAHLSFWGDARSSI